MNKKNFQLLACITILVLSVAAAFAYTAEQAANGKMLYGKYCAACHGANGEGGIVPQQFGKMAGSKASPVAGPGYLPKMMTAGETYEFAMKNMPADKPGSLKSEEYLDIISFALQANGVKPDAKALTPDSAKEIKLAH
jgi:polar amino acid transport system substrate-binding protein